MSFSGSGASAQGSGTSFTKNEIQGETRSFTGQLTKQARDFRARQELENDAKLQKDIKQGQIEIIDKHIKEFFDEPDEEFQKKMENHAKSLMVLQLLEKDVAVEDTETYYKLLDDYNRQAEFDDVEEFASARAKEIQENMIQDFNDLFDAVGKVDAIAGAEAVENIGEFTTDIIQSIVDKNPKYGTIAIMELLGLEFDEDGNFDLQATIADNAKPYVQKLMARYIGRGLSRVAQLFGSTGEQLTEELAPLIEEVAEEQAPFIENSLMGELSAIAETEAFALPGFIIGGLQGSAALTRAIGGILQAINLSHDAYTQGNHTWADQNSGFIGFVKKIPLIGELANSIAFLVEEAKDMRDYRKGETDAQKFQVEYEDRQEQKEIEESVLNLVANGSITYDMIEKGQKFSFIRTDDFGRKRTITVDLGKYKVETLEEKLNKDISTLKEDGIAELNNLEDFYNEETQHIISELPKGLTDTFQFNEKGEIISWDATKVSLVQKTVKSKKLGDILFRGGRTTESISQQEFLNLIQHYNDFVEATDEVQAQKEKIMNM